MSLTLLAWLATFLGLAALAFWRPVFGVALYMLTFFLCPPFWWWGDPIAGYRWNLYAGSILAAAVLMSGALKTAAESSKNQCYRRLGTLAVLMLVNVTIVHYGLALSPEASFNKFILFAKFVLLFFLMRSAVRTEYDFRIALLAIVLGATYIGYEVTINDRGSIEQNRLEGIGAPAASGANEHASLMVTLLPLTGALFIAGRRWERLLMCVSGPFIVNVVLLCNSRGAFLGAITSAVVFLSVTPREVRRSALKVIALGAIAVWALLGDERIIERFWTTFADRESRDASAQSRLDFAKAGLAMLRDYPLGAGGDAFKRVRGDKYLRSMGIAEESHAIHNGFINEACEWGLQGLILRIAFIATAIQALVATSRRYAQHPNEQFMAICGCAMLGGMAAFLVTCLFGDRLDNEWGYWMVALASSYAALYSRRYELTERRESTETNETEGQLVPVGA